MTNTSRKIQRILKRAIDLFVATLLSLLTLPVVVAIALLIQLSMGRPVFFKQARPGYMGRVFNILKFRTMSDSRDSRGDLLPDDQRLTLLGRFIRSTSLDELPQLWNVLRGEMSLVGPRPLLVEYLRVYTAEEYRRHHVPPGITGWVQVNGRNDLTWKEKFQLDIWYVDNWSLWLDFRILILTAKAVALRRGVSKTGHATTQLYDGTN